VAGAATQQSRQQGPRAPARRPGPVDAARSAEPVLDALEQSGVHDGRVFAGVDLVLVADLAKVGDVAEQPAQGIRGEGCSAAGSAGPCRPLLVDPAAAVQLLNYGQQPPEFQVQLEDVPDPGGFRVVDHEVTAARIEVVAEDERTAGPLALAAGGGHLVSRPLGDQLTLELGKDNS